MVFRRTFLCSIVLISMGCATTQYQERYFAAANLDDETAELKFYRLKIKGNSVNTQTSFLAGFYDADALRNFYGETPSKGEVPSNATSPNAGQYQLYFNSVTQQWEVYGQETLYAVMYGANADVLAQQIDAFATSEEVGNAMSSLAAAAITGDDLLDAEEVEGDAVAAQTQATELAAKLKELAGGLDSTSTSTDVQSALRTAAGDAVRAMARAAGFPVPASLNTPQEILEAAGRIRAFLAARNS